MLASGRTISHFEILEKLGEGGMGVVYKARDPRLNRIVALKLISSEHLVSKDVRSRFIHEARSASALNHPNIVTVYEIDTVDDTAFIAMEFVEGKTLHDKLESHRIPVRGALQYGIGIADALSAAHSIGIVHRDVKPANILINEAGIVKVLDFGVAKLIDEPTSASEETRTIEPQTERGLIVGTPSYMSPEQAEGRKVDTRSDVFSFGIVLYEMLTGHKPFAGASNLSTLSAILEREPERIKEDSGVPRDLERIVTRCLRKDPAARYQVVSDVKLALEEVKEDLESGKVTTAVLHPASRWKRLSLVVALLAALLLGAGLMRVLDRSTDSARKSPTLRFFRLTSDAGLTTDPAISPDGKLVAYASDRAGGRNLDIWVQQAAGGSPVRLTRDEANERQPSFSPDGTKIVFRSERENGGIYVVSALGGEPVRVATAGFNPQFSPDGQRIAYWTGGQVSVSTLSKIYVVPATGGAAEEVPTNIPYSRQPLWTADGRQLLFWGASENLASVDWYTIEASPNLGSSRPVRCGVIKSLALSGPEPTLDSYYPRGWLGTEVLFAMPAGQSRDLWSLPISTGTNDCHVVGPPHPLTAGLESASHPSAASADRIVWANLQTDINVWGLPVDVESGRVVGELRQLTYGLSPKSRPYLSRNGKRLAFNNGQRVAVMDIATGRGVMITSTPAVHASLTADGSRVVYASGFKPGIIAPDLFVDDLQGEIPERVCSGCGLPPAGWSTDEQKILYDWGVPQSLSVFDLKTKSKRELLRQPGRAFTQGSFSPDDRWILFLATAGPSRQQVYVARYGENAAISDEAQWIPITDGKALDSQPRWSPEGKLVYYLSDRDGFRCLWARRLIAETKRPAGEPFAVYHLHTARRSLSNIPTVGYMGLGVSADQIVFNLGDSTGNIWMADLHSVK